MQMKKILIGTLSVFSLLVMLGNFIYHQEPKQTLTTADLKYTWENYSITLNGYFSKSEKENTLVAYTSKEVYIEVYKFPTNNGVLYYNDDKFVSIPEFAGLIMSFYEVAEDDLQQSDAGKFFFEKIEYNGIINIYMFAIFDKDDDGFYVTVFYCEPQNENKYREAFIKWAASIEINN